MPGLLPIRGSAPLGAEKGGQVNRYHRKWLRIFRRRENAFLRRVFFRDGEHEHGKRYETMRKAARRLNALRMRHVWNKPGIPIDDKGRALKPSIFSIQAAESKKQEN